MWASEVIWSVHHAHPRLDRAGRATGHGFKFVSHEDLTAIIRQELTSNNGCYGVGNVWRRTNCILMGGSFSAQGADLHSVWGAYENRKWFTAWVGWNAVQSDGRCGTRIWDVSA